MVRKSIQLTANLRSGPILVDCERSLFSQSSVSSAGLESEYARFPRSRDHPEGLLAVYNFSGSHTFSLTATATGADLEGGCSGCAPPPPF